MNNKVRLAIVGMGEMGILRSIIASAHPKFELVCLVEPSRIQARIAGKQLGVPYYNNFIKAYNNEQFDIVFICSPNHKLAKNDTPWLSVRAASTRREPGMERYTAGKSRKQNTNGSTLSGTSNNK